MRFIFPVFISFLSGLPGAVFAFNVDAGTDKVINCGESVTIGGSPSASGGLSPYTYSWNPTTGLNDAGVANPTASPSETTIYTLKVTDSDGFNCSAMVQVSVRTSQIEGVGFTGDHMISKWPTGAKVDSPDGTDPIWTPGGGVNDPVSYSKGDKPVAFVDLAFNIAFSGTFDLRVKKGSNIVATKNGIVITGDKIRVKNIHFTEALSSSVKKTNELFKWEIKIDGDWCEIGASGGHEFYWTNGSPLKPEFTDFQGNSYTNLYDRSLELVCAYVSGNANIAEKATEGIDDDINYNPAKLLPAGHPLHAYTTGGGVLCGDLAYLLRGLLRSIGEDGTVTFIWAGPNNTTTQPYTYRGSTIPTFRILEAAHDNAPLNPHFSYHAVVKKNGRLYDPSYGKSYLNLNFDETANNATPQQQNTAFPTSRNLPTWTCPH